jgi:hypothetical protein
MSREEKRPARSTKKGRKLLHRTLFCLFVIFSIAGFILDWIDVKKADAVKHLQVYTASAQQQIKDIQPFVVAGIFYNRMLHCRYDWRFQCLCPDWRARLALPPSPELEPFWLERHRWTTFSMPVETIEQECVLKERLWPFSWLPKLSFLPQFLPVHLLSVLLGLPDMAVYTAKKIVAAGPLAWVLGGITAFCSLVFVLGLIGRNFYGGILGFSMILLLLPGVVSVVAFLVQTPLWVAIWLFGKTLTPIVILIGLVVVIVLSVHNFQNIEATGRLVRRRLHRYRPGAPGAAE